MANRQGELTIIAKAKDLVNHTLKLTNNANLFPKKVRFTLCQRMQNITLQILHDIIAANEIYPESAEEWKRRLDLQREVLTGCKMFLTFLDIALEQGYVDIRRCEYWTGLTTDVKNLAASWRKKDVERCKQQTQGVQNGQPRGAAALSAMIRAQGCALYVHPPRCALAGPRTRRTRTTCAT